ncbi:ABC transporter permease [Mycobacterium sp. NAZ190054]|uniref:ABC transporter permease n=1 Tax=Mycobacterium sp. NAZ190054 TaxID=1747766 RepID=UPI0012E37217|nr:ABC transporter permease [Mycobacterium sp. NAZ190054]
MLALPFATLLLNADWSDWVRAWQNQRAIDAALLSAGTSLTAVLLMAAFGIPLGYFLAHTHSRLRPVLICVVLLPMVTPGPAGGILLLLAYGPHSDIGGVFAAAGVPLIGSFAAIVLAQVYVASPFVIMSAMVAFRGVDPRLEHAAATLGDKPIVTFFRVTLPVAGPTIAAGLALAWVRALGEFGATVIVAYNPQTLPVHLWVRFQAEGLAGALPLAFLLMMLAAIATALWTISGGLLAPRRMKETSGAPG